MTPRPPLPRCLPFVWSAVDRRLLMCGAAPAAMRERLAARLAASRDAGTAELGEGRARWAARGALRLGIFEPAGAGGTSRPGFLLLARDPDPRLRAAYGDPGLAALDQALINRLAGLAVPDGGGAFAAPVLGDPECALERLRAAASSQAVCLPEGPALPTLSAAAVADVEDPDAALRTLHARLPEALARGPEAMESRRTGGAEAVSEAVEALRGNRVTLAFQPVLRADFRGPPAFHEALVRLRGADGALVPAGRFMPEVEALGLARLFDRRVLTLALERLRDDPLLRLSVNLSPTTLADPVWIGTLEAAACSIPDATRRLIVELTETGSGLRPDLALPFVARLRKLGSAFAIDDFGAGCTALAQIGALRPDILKIDGALVRGIRTDPTHRAVLSGIAAAARELDIMTVAEFVASPEDAEALAGLGYDALQGNWIGPAAAEPMPRTADQEHGRLTA